MSSEKFCLRWNDFESNISSAFRELRDDKDFFDVTLACDDDQIQAHKVILSACSPFFRNVLRRNPHQHPLLYLKNVKYTDLQAVLNFMYHGEVNVAQEELNSFLAVAEDLRVKGLTQNQPGSQNTKASSSYQSSKDKPVSKAFQRPPDREPPPLKRPRPAPPVHQPHDEEIQEVIPIKSEPRDTSDQSNTATTPQHHAVYNTPQPVALAEEENSMTTYQEEQGGYEEYEQYEEQYGDQQAGMDMVMVQGQGGDVGKGTNLNCEDLTQYTGYNPDRRDYYCTLCNKFQSKKPSKVKDHVEAIHFPGQFIYSCNICEKTFNGKNSFAVHNSLKHSKKRHLLQQ